MKKRMHESHSFLNLWAEPPSLTVEGLQSGERGGKPKKAGVSKAPHPKQLFSYEIFGKLDVRKENYVNTTLKQH
jgi:hypothetical protein